MKMIALGNLGQTAGPSPITGLKRGDGFASQGKANLAPFVRQLQNMLSRAGHPVKADGLFGGGTERAVKAFQRKAGLSATGIVDVQTANALSDAQSTVIDFDEPLVITASESLKPSLPITIFRAVTSPIGLAIGAGAVVFGGVFLLTRK